MHLGEMVEKIKYAANNCKQNNFTQEVFIMKKIKIIVAMLIAIIIMGTANVFAATTNELINEVYSIGSKYGLTNSDKVKIERYLRDNPVTEAEADKLIEKAKEIDSIMQKAGTTDITKLSEEDKSKIKEIAEEAASILNLTLTIKNGKIEIYKDGKLIEVVSIERGKLAYTGNNNFMVYGIIAVAVIALATLLVVKKRNVNA